jgi:type I restriction-modification system DNA methylase subunit/transcriptional regulator with XRE-family HTH domain
MNKQSSIRQLVADLVTSDTAGRTGLAAKLNVSESTVARWESGTTNPRPTVANKIRALASKISSQQVREPVSAYGWHEPERDEDLRVKIHTTLSAIREALHKGGRLSSRQEALDEISKLLFAHVISIHHSGAGISSSLPKVNRTPATALRNFVSDTFKRYLPSSLAHELSISDFELRLRDSEDKFAAELLSAFRRLDAATIQKAVTTNNGVDVLNEVFGQFLADSFIEEKELGQYLTPTEVVRFMTRLGLGSLSEPLFEELIHPINCTRVGHILDPSCGVGSFLTEAIRVLHPQVASAHGAQGAATWLNNMFKSVVIGVDKSERMIRLSLTNLSLFGAESAMLHFGNALARHGHDGKIANSFNNSVQLILTNPPFGANFSSTEIAEYKIATEWCSRKPGSVDSELLFLERYVDWLKPGGTLVSIVPDSILTNRGLFSDLRSGISRSVELRSVISLPQVTFGAAGTTTKTSILHLVKRRNGPSNKPVYFSICKDIGYSVATRSSQRRKVANGHNQLVELLPEALREQKPTSGRIANVPASADRWDATFHVGLSLVLASRLELANKTDIFVRDVATLSTVRVSPARSAASDTFKYIEISDVNSLTLDVASKELRCENAPSRARKLVRVGDVLVSTVRPERRTIGVVPQELDGAVCSTGFAVLKCNRVDPTVLALLLQTDFANEQILRNNIGIAYPAITEECLLDILLPIKANDLSQLAEAGENLRALREQLSAQEAELKNRVNSAVLQWTN